MLENGQLCGRVKSMVSRERILDDLARLAGGAATLLGEAGKQANENFRGRLDSLALKLDLVPREDFERLELVVETLREELEGLKRHVLELEGQAGKKSGKKSSGSRKKKA
ncbi:MAG: accessory factor UbiK family protein [Alphaproteobacteria bacterium]|nr:accessory factor UbiK family protein [Alphaproteobacteria bacterium]